MSFDSESFDQRHPEFRIPLPEPARRTRKRRTVNGRKVRRGPNYAGRNTAKTQRLHDRIEALLQVHDGLTLREIGEGVGISRQLARYHVLKMVAHRRLVVILEPCEVNGGVQYRVWERVSYAMQAIRDLRIGVAA